MSREERAIVQLRADVDTLSELVEIQRKALADLKREVAEYLPALKGKQK